MSESFSKFQILLRELFQFDCADLDFGIYRIMNLKRDVIERFIVEDLPGFVRDELNTGALAVQAQVATDLEETAQQIRNTLAQDAIDADGNLVRFQDTDIGKKYLELREKARGGGSRDAIEATIFNHLYAFFSRYYQDGDFISKPRYSKRHRYAIPYNGEEVHLHWANKDQYYVKTGEQFRNYSFQVRGITVHFKLQKADVEQDNVKGDKRLFLPCDVEPTWDENTKQLDIAFEFRPLTAQEQISYSSRNQQEAILAEAVEKIPGRLEQLPDVLNALTAERHKIGEGEPVSFLKHHLKQYTRRNTSDFFIHRDLKGFLEYELEFYLKNELLNLDELVTGGEDRAEGWFQLMRTVRSVGGQIIEFLSQIENFQKMLWEKHKFITETQYCIAVGHVDYEFYEAIAGCEAQWEEWKTLLSINDGNTGLFSQTEDKIEKRVEFLKNSPTLVVDTKHFDEEFVDNLLGSFSDLDEMTDGVLIHGENWQALNLLSEKYDGEVNCVHIDPPYNTQSSGFLYKNEYQHSSWLSMMHSRIAAAVQLLVQDGAFLCHIDENEYERLHLVFNSFPIRNSGTVVWDKRNPMTGGGGVAIQHEYVIWRSDSETAFNLRNQSVISILNKAKEIFDLNEGPTPEAKRSFSTWVGSNSELSGGERAYRFLDEDGNVYQTVSLRAPEPRQDPKFHVPLIHPTTGQPCPVPPNGFSRTPETLQRMINRGEIIFGIDHTTQPRQKRLLVKDSKRQVTSIIQDATRGKMDLKKLGLEDFPYCHSVRFYESLLGASAPEDDHTVLDFFAGSGTTGHAVINLNREDGGQRKFILVEMGEYFDTVLLPRIKKVKFTPEWKEGKPKHTPTPEEAERGPRIVKYMRLESYEDVLNNIDFDEASGQHALQFDDYLLKYMLRWETKRSSTFLNVEKLSQPFSYSLNIHADGQTRQRTADVPETFNYLIGLRVETRRVCYEDDRRYVVYRGRIEQRRVVVIWRETQDWDKAALERDMAFITCRKLTEGADEIYVNGDSLIREAKALDPVFKRRMFVDAHV